MENCWQILGLDPASATERDVKSAYAKLIKIHRPDEDPEGFQRARQAMENAIQLLRSGAHLEPTASSDDEAPLEPSGPSLPPPPTRPELIEAELAVAHARETVNPTAEAEALLKLLPVCQQLESGPAAIKLWQESLQRVTEGRIDRLVWWIKIEQLMTELEAGAAMITHAVLDHCEGSNDMSLALGLGSAIRDNPQRVANFEAGVVALRVAILTGFLVPNNVAKLCNFAFPHVNKQAREQLIPQAEQQAAVGRVMFGLRQEQMRFWHPRVLRPRAEWNWDDEASKNALSELARMRDGEWAGYGIVRQIVPDETFASLEGQVREHHRMSAGQALGTPNPQQTQTTYRRSRTGWSWATWPVIVVVINLIRMVASNFSDTSSTSSYTPPPRPPATQQWTTPGGTYTRPAPSTSLRSSAVTSSQTEIATQRVDEMQRQFERSVNDPNSPFAQLSKNMPASNASTAAQDLQKQLTARARAHVDQLLKEDKGAAFWVDNLKAIDREGVKQLEPIKDDAKRREVIVGYRQKMITLVRQMHATPNIGTTEQRVLEIVMYDAESSFLQIEVAMLQMADGSVPDLYLPVWEDVAQLAPAVRKIVIQPVAAYVLKQKEKSLFGSDRDRLATLARVN